MLGIKRIDKYVIKNFLTLFFATFFICSFVLIMQVLWFRIGDLVGKGIPLKILAEYFFYVFLSLVPMALPLAILLASLMTFGNMGENLELLAMKSAGISLFRVMLSLIILVALISIGAFAFSNNVIPIAQKQMWVLTHSIQRTSPELNIPTGEFYGGIDRFKLYVRKKNHETGALNDVMVYDFSNGFDKATVTTADTVYVKSTEDKKHLKLIFINGESFENLKQNSTVKSKNVPYRRETFRRKEMLLEFDSEFSKMDDSYLNNQHVSKDIVRLKHDLDSINLQRDSLHTLFYSNMLTDKYYDKVFNKVDTVNRLRDDRLYDIDSLFRASSYQQAKNITGTMRAKVSSLISDYNFERITIEESNRYYVRHAIEWHKKFTLSFACLIFFFIGAPLGAIIRKGGLGMPVVISIVMFVIYYIIDTFSIKMARELVWDVVVGMWASSMVLLPTGIFLTYKAATDSSLFNTDAYKLLYNKIKTRIHTNKNKTL